MSVRQKIENLCNDPACSFWLREAIETALLRDPAKALNDAEVLHILLKERWEELAESWKNSLSNNG